MSLERMVRRRCPTPGCGSWWEGMPVPGLMPERCIHCDAPLIQSFVHTPENVRATAEAIRAGCGACGTPLAEIVDAAEMLDELLALKATSRS